MLHKQVHNVIREGDAHGDRTRERPKRFSALRHDYIPNWRQVCDPKKVSPSTQRHVSNVVDEIHIAHHVYCSSELFVMRQLPFAGLSPPAHRIVSPQRRRVNLSSTGSCRNLAGRLPWHWRSDVIGGGV
jgi:hypothetical protein